MATVPDGTQVVLEERDSHAHSEAREENSPCLLVIFNKRILWRHNVKNYVLGIKQKSTKRRWEGRGFAIAKGVNGKVER